MAFLETQKCTHLPSQPLLTGLLQHYFLYAHQSLPILDEGELWSIIDGNRKGETTISLLVFQAVLFVACSVSTSLNLRNSQRQEGLTFPTCEAK
jgi:hypothetical protein